jgi:hypothetical protein
MCDGENLHRAVDDAIQDRKREPDLSRADAWTAIFVLRDRFQMLRFRSRMEDERHRSRARAFCRTVSAGIG